MGFRARGSRAQSTQVPSGLTSHRLIGQNDLLIANLLQLLELGTGLLDDVRVRSSEFSLKDGEEGLQCCVCFEGLTIRGHNL